LIISYLNNYLINSVTENLTGNLIGILIRSLRQGATDIREGILQGYKTGILVVKLKTKKISPRYGVTETHEKNTLCTSWPCVSAVNFHTLFEIFIAYMKIVK
jgi:hypothetical protein